MLLLLPLLHAHVPHIERRSQTTPCPEQPTWAHLCKQHTGGYGSGDKCTGGDKKALASRKRLGAGHVGHFYQEFYPEFVDPLRCLNDLAFLEIGVSKGYSLRMWREFFTGNSTLHFVDLDPAAKKHEAPGTKVWIGDSNSAELMQRIVAEIPGGAFDLIVDDGSHAPADVRGLFMQLFPLLKPGGIYAVEDLNSAWDKRGVVPDRREVPLASGENGTHVDMLRDMIKTLNRVNFDPSYSAGVNGIDHLVGSIFCTEEACALRRRTHREHEKAAKEERVG